jgi:hypothetical protein
MESGISGFFLLCMLSLFGHEATFSKLLPLKCHPVPSWPEGVNAVARGESPNSFVTER